MQKVITSYLAYQMICQRSGEVITQIKAPLQKAILSAAFAFSERFGKITKANTVSVTTHSLIDIRNKFLSFESNKGREPLFQAAFTLLTAEVEHDPYYRYRFDWLIEEVLKKLLEGEWETRPVNAMGGECWLEPEPYGGENSIVSKLIAHKDEIKAILKEG